MISYVYDATCDRCGFSELIKITGREGFSMINAERKIEANGWKIDGDKTICENCVENENEW